MTASALPSVPHLATARRLTSALNLAVDELLPETENRDGR